MNVRLFYFVITLICFSVLPAWALTPETAKAIKESLIANGFEVKSEKGDPNEGEMKILTMDNIEFIFVYRLFPAMEDAQRAALKDATRVSAGVQILDWSKNHLVCLHRQFLCGQKNTLYYKIESASGDQIESLKKIYELVDHVL